MTSPENGNECPDDEEEFCKDQDGLITADETSKQNLKKEVFDTLISGPFLFKYPKKSSEPESGNESTEDQEERIQDDSTTVDTETNKQNLKQELLATFNRFEVILFISTVLVTGLLQGVYINFTALRMQELNSPCLLYTSPSPRDGLLSRMPSSA